MTDARPLETLEAATIAATTATVGGPGVCSCCRRRTPAADPEGPGLGLGAAWLCATCVDALTALLTHTTSHRVGDPEAYFKALPAPDPEGQG